MPVSRRVFLKTTRDVAASAVIAPPLVALLSETTAASPLGLPIGSQTYPHRALIKEGNFAGLAKTFVELGIQSVELCSPIGYSDFATLSDAKQVRQMLADHGLTCVSGHFSMRELHETQSKSIDWAREVGITQMITATLGGGANSPTMDEVKRAADEYNRIAAVAAQAGIQQGLHNEGFESSEVDGKRTYDLLFELLDPKLVKFQFQMSTISRGFVAHEYFTKYPGRFISIHLQDVDLNATPPPPPAGQPSTPARGRGVQASLGKGSIDWIRTFRAAKTAGVKNYFVEQNMELTKASVAYLKTLQV
jgi:sugar phosphate isomerase/epimerase